MTTLNLVDPYRSHFGSSCLKHSCICSPSRAVRGHVAFVLRWMHQTEMAEPDAGGGLNAGLQCLQFQRNVAIPSNGASICACGRDHQVHQHEQMPHGQWTPCRFLTANHTSGEEGCMELSCQSCNWWHRLVLSFKDHEFALSILKPPAYTGTSTDLPMYKAHPYRQSSTGGIAGLSPHCPERR